jgi:ATP-dependent Zn protease
VDEEIRTLVMRGYETARQIIERQRPAVKALAEELLQEESVDAARLRQILAGSVVPNTAFPAAVRDALIEARLQA